MASVSHVGWLAREEDANRTAVDCQQESINPVLVGPDGSEYACSAIRTQPAGQQVTSTW